MRQAEITLSDPLRGGEEFRTTFNAEFLDLIQMSKVVDMAKLQDDVEKKLNNLILQKENQGNQTI
jgi:hypothetical protein